MDTKTKLAFEIFLKIKPQSPLTVETTKGYESAIGQALEIAELFIVKSSPIQPSGLVLPLTNIPPSEL